MTGVIVKNVRLVTGEAVELSVENGRFVKSGSGEVLDGRGLIVAPGFCDPHVHLRDPGQTHKEDIATGTAAAAAGGFTAVACMPNTTPALDTPEEIGYVLRRAEETARARVLPIASISEGLRGERRCDFEALISAGAAAFSDDGRPVTSDAMMKEALLEGARLDRAVISHCEAVTLSKGVMNEGETQRKLGVTGLPRSAEDLMIARDAVLAAETGCPVHIAHVSTKSGLEIVRTAKAKGVPITCETCPHYFTLNDTAVELHGANAKMSPPLRSEEDRLAVIEAICDGTVDMLSTDHAPHAPEEKGRGLVDAPNGIVGLESAFALGVTYLVRPGHITLARLCELMGAAPRRLLREEKNTLSVGDRADFVLFDPEERFVFDREKLHSKSRNTPFHGMELYGRVLLLDYLFTQSVDHSSSL